MTSIQLGDINMAYLTSGQGAPVILVHGHPFDHTMWAPQIAALSTSYRVVTPDLRGYGKSSLPQHTATRFEDYATDVLRLADHLKIESFHLAGLSLGGQIIMEIYRQAPRRVKSLILADTFASPDSAEAKQSRYEAADRLEREGMEGYAEEVISKMITPAHVASQPEVASHVKRMMKGTDPSSAATALRARSERINYLAEVLPNINVPSLIIVGRDDEFTPVNKAEEIEQNINNSKLVIIEDAGHMPNLEQPELFNSAVLDFLNTLDG